MRKFMKKAIYGLIGLVIGAGLTLGSLCLCGQDAADRLLFFYAKPRALCYNEKNIPPTQRVQTALLSSS